MAKPTGKPIGRPKAFNTVKEFDTLIEDYKQNCAELEEPFTIIGLAVFMGVHKDTLFEYAKKEDFSDSYKKAMSYAENSLVKNALDGKYNPTVSIFLLKNNHNYTDKTEVKQETKDTSKQTKWWLDDSNNES